MSPVSSISMCNNWQGFQRSDSFYCAQVQVKPHHKFCLFWLYTINGFFSMKPNNVSFSNVEVSRQFHIWIWHHQISLLSFSLQKQQKYAFNKVHIKIKDAWTEEDLWRAIDLANSTTKSYRSIAKECGVKESTLRFRLKKLRWNKELKSAGRETVLTVLEENELAKCISVVCNYRFSPIINDIEVILLPYCSFFSYLQNIFNSLMMMLIPLKQQNFLLF